MVSLASDAIGKFKDKTAKSREMQAAVTVSQYQEPDCSRQDRDSLLLAAERVK
jgi:hypothetical protein